jgi:hypothetical protein
LDNTPLVSGSEEDEEDDEEDVDDEAGCVLDTCVVADSCLGFGLTALSTAPLASGGKLVPPLLAGGTDDCPVLDDEDCAGD